MLSVRLFSIYELWIGVRRNAFLKTCRESIEILQMFWQELVTFFQEMFFFCGHS
jgi:hypothetical protein